MSSPTGFFLEETLTLTIQGKKYLTRIVILSQQRFKKHSSGVNLIQDLVRALSPCPCTFPLCDSIHVPDCLGKILRAGEVKPLVLELWSSNLGRLESGWMCRAQLADAVLSTMSQRGGKPGHTNLSSHGTLPGLGRKPAPHNPQLRTPASTIPQPQPPGSRDCRQAARKWKWGSVNGSSD